MKYYLLIINVITMILFGMDKYFAIKNKQRIAEKNLIVCSILGGCFGGFLGMLIFHHKTRKIKFKITMLISLVSWSIIILKLGEIL